MSEAKQMHKSEHRMLRSKVTSRIVRKNFLQDAVKRAMRCFHPWLFLYDTARVMKFPPGGGHGPVGDRGRRGRLYPIDRALNMFFSGSLLCKKVCRRLDLPAFCFAHFPADIWTSIFIRRLVTCTHKTGARLTKQTSERNTQYGITQNKEKKENQYSNTQKKEKRKMKRSCRSRSRNTAENKKNKKKPQQKGNDTHGIITERKCPDL